MVTKEVHEFIEYAKFTADGEFAQSPSFDVSDFDRFLLMVKLRKSGAPSGSYLKVQVFFTGLNGVAFLYSTNPFPFLVDENPIEDDWYALSGECVGSSMFIKVTVTKGVTLNPTNYLDVSVVGEFMRREN